MGSTSHESFSTDRLRFDPLDRDDLTAVHDIFTDPGTWRHLPSGRHTTAAQTERLLVDSQHSWEQSGLGRWAIRLRHPLPGGALPAGTLIGLASATMLACGARNLGYRLTPASWGCGLATEAASAALAAAHAVSPDVAVTARALAVNPASVRVLDRIGLQLLWSGRGRCTGAVPTAALERRVFADRQLSPALLNAIVALG